MPRRMVPTSIKREYRNLVEQLVLDLSQSLSIIQESPMFVDCPNCIWDSINRKSSNVFDASFTAAVSIFVGTDQQRFISPTPFSEGRCPVCIGEGQLFTAKEICIPAMINFISGSSGGNFTDLPAGKEGVNFMLVKTLACNYELIANNEIFLIHNGVKCEKFRPPFVRGMGGEEAVCEVLLQTTEAGQRSTAKFGNDDKLRRESEVRRKIRGPTDSTILTGRLRGR